MRLRAMRRRQLQTSSACQPAEDCLMHCWLTHGRSRSHSDICTSLGRRNWYSAYCSLRLNDSTFLCVSGFLVEGSMLLLRERVRVRRLMLNIGTLVAVSGVWDTQLNSPDAVVERCTPDGMRHEALYEGERKSGNTRTRADAPAACTEARSARRNKSRIPARHRSPTLSVLIGAPRWTSHLGCRQDRDRNSLRFPLHQ